MCMKESCFPDCWKISSVVPVFKKIGERHKVKNYPSPYLSSFCVLVQSDQLKKYCLFSNSKHGFRPSWSNADLLAVVSKRIVRAFSRSGATRAVALDTSKVSDRVWHASLLHKCKSYGISGWVFHIISSFLSNKNIQWMLQVPAGISSECSILRPTLFLFCMNDLLDDVIYNIAIYPHDTTFFRKWDQASDLWQQLSWCLVFEFEFELWNTVDRSKKWLVDCFIWQVSYFWCYWCKNGWACSWRKILF